MRTRTILGSLVGRERNLGSHVRRRRNLGSLVGRRRRRNTHGTMVNYVKITMNHGDLDESAHEI